MDVSSRSSMEFQEQISTLIPDLLILLLLMLLF